jgi:hypothetical protein
MLRSIDYFAASSADGNSNVCLATCYATKEGAAMSWIRHTVRLRWQRARGYQVEDGRRLAAASDDTNILSASDAEGPIVIASGSVQTYDVALGEWEIYRHLIEMAATPEGAIDFAKRWGLLTAGGSQPLQGFITARRKMRNILMAGRVTGLRRAAEILDGQELGNAKLRLNSQGEVNWYLRNLYDFLWVEVFHAIGAGVAIARCSVCSEPILQQAMGPDADTCSNRCRTKKYRDANRDALNEARREARRAARC